MQKKFKTRLDKAGLIIYIHGMKPTDEKKPMEMEVLSDETRAKLKAIAARIDELNAQIKELQQEAYDLVPKHTFDECREMKCIHTYRNRWDCHHACVRRENPSGKCFAHTDFYEKEQPVFKPKVEYPTLGWKKVTTPGMKWKGEWHGDWDVVKETEKTLVLSDKTILLKSTIHMIEDVIYISDRSGSTYFCADDPATLDMQVELMHIEFKEQCERTTRLVTPMIDGIPM